MKYTNKKKVLSFNYIFVICNIMFLIGLTTCASTATYAPTNSRYGIDQSLKYIEPINSQYISIEDSVAYTMVKIWASQTFYKGKDAILVDDIKNQILAGKDSFHYTDMDLGLTTTMDYKIVVSNGTAILTISSIHVVGSINTKTQREADEFAIGWMNENYIKKLKNTFKNVFN